MKLASSFTLALSSIRPIASVVAGRESVPRGRRGGVKAAPQDAQAQGAGPRFSTHFCTIVLATNCRKGAAPDASPNEPTQQEERQHRFGARGADRIENHLPVDAPLVSSVIKPGAAAALPTEVVRRKYFHLQPMSQEEALVRMREVDHDFFIYLDAATGAVNVIYERRAGGVGVIVPLPEGATSPPQ